MDRIFHARITLGQYLFLLLVTLMTIHEMWVKHAIMAVIFMLLLIVAVELLIHTTYTLTVDNRLLLFYGRFSSRKEILLTDIISIEHTSTMRIGSFAFMHYLLIGYGNKKKCVALFPVKEELFIKMISERCDIEIVER